MTDCVRAPAAQRAGVRSGVCFPLIVGGRVIGTMDFFTTDTIELSDSQDRRCATCSQLVSQRLDVLRRTEESARNSRDLLDTVARLREAAGDTGRVAVNAVSQASTMTTEVEALGAGLGRGGRGDPDHLRHRRPDQPAGAQRHHRGRPGR
jgi:hypothetical protein